MEQIEQDLLNGFENFIKKPENTQKQRDLELVLGKYKLVVRFSCITFCFDTDQQPYMQAYLTINKGGNFDIGSYVHQYGLSGEMLGEGYEIFIPVPRWFWYILLKRDIEKDMCGKISPGSKLVRHLNGIANPHPFFGGLQIRLNFLTKSDKNYHLNFYLLLNFDDGFYPHRLFQ